MAQVKVKLLESRATLHCCHRIGSVISVEESDANRMVERFQAEFDGDPKRTAKVRKGSEFRPGGGPESNPSPKKSKGKKSGKSKKTPAQKTPPKKTATNIHLLGLDEKIADLLTAVDKDHDVPAFKTIGQLDAWIKKDGDLSEKAGIGRATRAKIEVAVTAFVADAAAKESQDIDEPAQDPDDSDDDFDDDDFDDDLDDENE